MAQPRVVYAMRSQKVRVHTPGRKVPIIVVPDILGTRLSDPESGELVWNPKGPPFGEDPHSYVVNVERLMQMSAELVPDETHPYPTVTMNRNHVQSKVKHGRSMLVNIYGPLFQSLGNLPFGGTFHDHGVAAPLYFCGYDFRQDNARAALRLAEMVDEALEDTGERKVILVGHGMGGQICRYYCRALAGESKVHQTFLMGTPILGTPTAYAALKHGIEGLYVREITDAARGGDAGGLVFECLNQFGDMVTAGGAHGARGVLGSLFGELYMLLCVAAGRWLSRRETRNLVRQMPSMYQLLPGAIHCRDNLHWLAFDPMATGVAPTGFMVPLPTVMEQNMEITAALLDLASGGQQVGTQMRTAVRNFMEGPSEGVPSARASRNAMPFVQMIARAFAVQNTFGSVLVNINWSAPDLFAEFARFGPPGRALWPEIEKLIAAFRAFFGQAQRTFIDCRNAKSLYEDVYTGFLDAADERPLVAASLPLFHRFDEVLTITPHPEEPMSMLDVLLGLLQALGAGFRAGFFGFAAMFTGSRAGQTYQRWQHDSRAGRVRAENENQLVQDRRRRERYPARAYIPPNTYIVYSKNEEMPSGGLLQPRAYVSYDDWNEVRTAFIPNFVSEGYYESSRGDGFVPGPSAFPEDRLLSEPFGSERQNRSKEVTNTRHSSLPAASLTTQFLTDKIREKLGDFLRS